MTDELPSRAERFKKGKSLRHDVPRESLAGLQSNAARDPVAILAESDATRVPELLSVRYGRMMENPFAFLRGAAAVMAAALVLGLASALVLRPAETVAGAVGKWESRCFCGIPRGVREPLKTCFWFSPASMLPPFPRRSSEVPPVRFAPWLLKRPATRGPKRIETVSSRCS